MSLKQLLATTISIKQFMRLWLIQILEKKAASCLKSGGNKMKMRTDSFLLLTLNRRNWRLIEVWITFMSRVYNKWGTDSTSWRRRKRWKRSESWRNVRSSRCWTTLQNITWRRLYRKRSWRKVLRTTLFLNYSAIYELEQMYFKNPLFI